MARLPLVLIAIAAIPIASAAADNVTLTGSDELGTTSFNTAGLWQNGTAPSAEHDYFTSDYRLRTPPNGGSYTFGGKSLTINNTNGYAQGLLYKGAGSTGVITINNLILDGGMIAHASGISDQMNLAGDVHVVSDSTVYAKQGTINILAPISGTGKLTIAQTDAPGDVTRRFVTLSGANNFTGNVDVFGKLRLESAGSLQFNIGASGVNNRVAGPGLADFNGQFNFDLGAASASIGDSWTIADVATKTFGPTFNIPGFNQYGSTLWSNGSYQFDETTGVLSVGGPTVFSYSFTNIIDSTVPTPNGNGNFVNIGDAAISGNRVAFKAREEGFVSHDSIFTSTGGPRTLVVQTPGFAPSDDFSYDRPPTGGRFHSLGRPVIDGGPVYFEARVFYQSFDVVPSFRYGDGIFLGEGFLFQNQTSPLIETVVSPRALPNFETYRVIGDPLRSNGYLAFRKSSGENSALDTIQVRSPGQTSTTMIVSVGSSSPLGGAFSLIDPNYDLSGPTVAFRGLVGSQEGIFTGEGGPLTTIVRKGDATPLGSMFDSVLDPTISGSNVAFIGTYAGGSGIFTGDGGALSTIVKTGDATPDGLSFTGFSVPTMALNLVAFRGDYAGGYGIYTKRGDELTKVVEIGDSMFGSSVTSLSFSDLGLDAGGTGNLAFTYGLADGRTGIAMANLGAARPTIFQDIYGKIPVPDSVGISWVPVADFSGRNLTKAWLEGADLRNANAQNANLTNAVLRGADLTDANLSGANLRGAVLDTARLNGANFSAAQVRGARLAREYLAVVDSCFGGVCFPPSAVGTGGITPAQLASTASYQAHDLANMNLSGNDFSNLSLAGQNLSGTILSLATLTGADLTGADIRRANFSRFPVSATLEGCHYGACSAFTRIIGSGITLEQLYSTTTYLTGDLAGINFGGNNLAGANFAYRNLANANFNDATLTDADFTGAEVRGAYFGTDIYTPPVGTGITFEQLSSTASYHAHDLTGIGLESNDLSQFNFVGQNLANANFRGATLTDADFSGANVRGATFSLSSKPFRYGDSYTGVVLRGIELTGTGISLAQLYSTASYQADDLTGVSFSFHNFTGANLAGKNLSGARFFGASLAGADLSQANLSNAFFGNFDATVDAAGWTTNDLVPAYLAGANLSGANLTNADFTGLRLCDELGCDEWPGADLRNTNLSTADARGANFFLARLDGANTANMIQSNGHIAGLDLIHGTSLVVRDYDGGSAVSPATGPLAIVVDEHLTMSATSTLLFLLEADHWDSTISFAPGILVARGGTIELQFAAGINPASQIGRTFQLFDWSGVTPTGEFSIASPYHWDTSNLYLTGEITFVAVPEPSLSVLISIVVMSGVLFTSRRCR